MRSFVTDEPLQICHPEPWVLQRRREQPREGPMYFVDTLPKRTVVYRHALGNATIP